MLRERFERDGYLLFEDALPKATIAAWRERSCELLGLAQDIARSGQGHVLSYSVVTGEVIRDHFEDLYAYYTSREMLGWVADVTGEAAIVASPNLRSSVNVNILRQGHRYHWHFDANPYTALLYLSTVPSSAGGELELYPRAGRDRVSIPPRAGTLVVMDGSVTYHRVAPVTAPCLRLSVPMVYPPFRDELRPLELDEYLYSSSSSA